MNRPKFTSGPVDVTQSEQFPLDQRSPQKLNEKGKSAQKSLGVNRASERSELIFKETKIAQPHSEGQVVYWFLMNTG